MKITFLRSHLSLVKFLIIALLMMFVVSSQAHTQSDSFLTLQVANENVKGEWHLALRDLDDAIGLDVNDDGKITWAELLSRKEAVCAYAFSRFHIEAENQTHRLVLEDFLVENHSDGAYVVLRFSGDGFKQSANLKIDYNAFFDIDPKHRGLLRLEKGGLTRLAVFSPETSSQTFEESVASSSLAFFTFLSQGVWHIWSGYDHILFLLALLLPGVLLRQNGAWVPVAASRPAFINVLRIVTAFTLAHSVTLSLSALGYVHLPTRLVESAIAASVVLAAFNNLFPFFAERGWIVAFAFGLLHGFGFANALRDLGLQHGKLAATLFGFNLGVELGQLAIVATFLPLALALRHLFFYQRFVLRFGSVAIIVVATTWMAERVFDFKWLPF